jgi:hypothetical protein
MAADAAQLSVPSLIVTVPVGVPAPGRFAVTLKLTVTFCPTTDASGKSEMIAVVVSLLSTTCDAVPELSLKFPSPA